ncbi:tRNA threonylcarbamoyladenosine biosynthesis protein TsaE [hydrothermal vent metagenome]|uniref:tRNA threonylcarbamoyladenosine biosynthesis protein TsaE n=1 Tax=hydrothermal vent metagenome TaxID=652676 RepID=A0A3B0WHR9_9ZZZZ
MSNSTFPSRHCFLANEAEQLNFAAIIATHIPPGTVIFLEGDLGTGKTTFVKGFLLASGYKGNVKSPTYTLVEPYEIRDRQFYHFDLYRLGSPDELEYAGGRDYFDSNAICLIEWPEKAKGFLPKADLVFQLEYHNEAGAQGRNCTISSQTELCSSMIQNIFKLLD